MLFRYLIEPKMPKKTYYISLILLSKLMNSVKAIDSSTFGSFQPAF